MAFSTGPVSTETPVDHGYAWVVLGSCIVMRLLSDGFWGTLGILLVNWETHFDVTSSRTAWIGSTFMLILLATAPISSALAHRLTYRVVVLTAGIINFVCLFALSLVSDIWHIYLIMPILGFGVGITYQTANSYFVYHFDKRYALANSLSSAAGGMAFLIFPPLIETLIISYGWRGALQLSAAIMANVCVCGSLLRPSKYEKQTKLDTQRLKPDVSTDQEGHPTKRNDCSFFRDMAKDFDLSLFRRVPFIFQAILNGLLYGGVYGSLIYFVPYAISIGIPDLKASFLMSVFGICCFIIRLSPVGILVDKKMVSASALTGVFYLIVGVAITMIPFTKTYAGLMVISAVYGLSLGIAGSVIMVVVTYSAGSKEKAPGAAAWLLQQCGIGSLIVIILSGFLHDITGTYQSSLVLSGVCTICMGFNVLADPLWNRWQTQLDKRRNRHSASSEYVYSSLAANTKPSQV